MSDVQRQAALQHLHTFGHKKAGTSTFSNPSLVSPTSPTLAEPTRGFGLPKNNIIQTATEESTNLQETQSADEQSLLSEAIPQRSFGHDISRIALRRPQAKLTVGEPNDKYEQEADRIANQVMRMASPTTPNLQPEVEEEKVEEIQTKPLVQRQEMLPEEERIQAKCEACEQEEPIQCAADGVPQVQPDWENRLNASQGGGSALPDEVRSFMEPRFGADFQQVRVHTDSNAVQMNRELNAQAFTHKQDIYFSAGKAPSKDALTAHELTHVVQQTGMVQHKLDDESQTQKFGQPVTTPKTDQFGIEPDGANSAPTNTHPTEDAGSKAIPPVDIKQEALSTQPSLPAPTQANSEAAYPSNSIPEKSGNAVLDKSATPELANVPQPGGVANEVVSPQTYTPQTEAAESQQSLPNPAGQLPQLDKAIDPSAMAIAEAEQPQELPEIPQPTMPESPELAQAAQQIIQTKEIEKAALTQTIEAQQNFLQQQTEIQVEAIQAATQGKIQGITADIAAKKAEVLQTFSTTKANLKGQIENHKTNIQAETTRGLNSLQQEVETKRKGANTTAENEAKQVEQTGQTEATRATTSTAESATAVNAIAKQQGDRYGSKPEEKTAARQGAGQASAEVVGKLTSRGQFLAKDAREAAQKAAQEFRAAGQKLAAGVGSNTAQVEKAIRDNANTITSQFISQITQQLQKIDTLQTKALASLENLKLSSISGIKEAGNSAAAAAKISGKTAATQVSQFKVASLNQLDKGAHQVVEKLNQVPKNKKNNHKAIDKFIQETKEPFQQTRLQLETALSSQVSGANNSLNQLGSAVSGHLDGLQQKVTGEADKATNSLSTGLAQVPEQAAQQVQQSVTSNKNANEQLISQFGGGIQQKIDEAKQEWVQQQQKVNNDIRSKVDEGIKSNKDVESKAPSDFAQVAQSAAEKAADPGWLQVLKGIGEGILKVLVGLAIFVAVVALVIFLLPEEIVAAIGIVGIAAIVGLGFLIYGFVTSFINRCEEFAKALHAAGVDDPPWYIYLAAGIAIPFVSLLDAVGISPILEGALNISILTGKDLNLTPEQRAEKITEGVLTIALMFILGRVLKGGKPGEVKPVEVEPGEVKPGEVKPGEVKPDEVKPVEPGVRARRTTADGHHEIKVTERGTIRCSPNCGDIQNAYPNELKQRADLQERLNTAKQKEATDPEAVAEEVKNIDAELAAVRRANLAKAKTDSRGTIEAVKKLLNDKENTEKLSGEDKGIFGERQRQIEKDWNDASESADGAKGDPDIEGLALEEFESINKKAKELESDIQKKLPKGTEDPPYVKENRPPLDEETFLADSGTYTRTGRKFQGREIYKDGDGRYYHVDNFHEGRGSEIEFYEAQGKHLGTLKPEGGVKDGPVKGRTLPDNLR
ncbi:eCIS core domain-containing protein [Nostoc sp.]|uniref:eCIS core domain-containing protein n=1 Tax=Nostoc sp. TaxID=1180 RepID=UPI002FF5F760